MKKRILLFCLGILITLSTFGQAFNFLPKKFHVKSYSSTITAYPCSLATAAHDDWMLDMYNNNPGWTSKFTFKSVHDIVKLVVDVDSGIKVDTSYRIRVNFVIYKDTFNGLPAPAPITASLDLEYDPDSLKPYQDLAIYKFSGSHSFRVVITDVLSLKSGPPVSLPSNKIPKNFRIDREIYTQRYDIPGPNFAMTQVLCTLNTSNEIVFYWNTVDYGTYRTLEPIEYDVEWAFIDDYKVNIENGSVTYGSSYEYDFTKNSSRVRVKDMFYKIPNVYEHGGILYRVRWVRPSSSNYAELQYGPWTVTASAGVSAAGLQLTTPHSGDSLNWQYTINFGEGGKYKQVLNYFDGAYKNRQTQTKINTDTTYTIAVDNVYDYEGRKIIQTLPTPVADPRLAYKKNMTVNTATGQPYKAADIDKFTCQSPDSLPPLSSTALANIYYSPLNPDKAGMQKFVPDAKGYPFMQSIYAPDNQLLWQGGAGYDHQLWTDHGTRYEYARATPNELTQLFGTEAGHYEFYPKTMTTDPNGQTSFSISNPHGQTVATGLIGLPFMTDKPLDALPTYSGAGGISFDILKGYTQEKIPGGLYANTSFYADNTGPHSIRYGVRVPAFNLCGYYLRTPITYSYEISNDCGEFKLGSPNETTISASETYSYNNPFDYSAPKTNGDLAKGKYTATKTLKFSYPSIRKHIDSFIVNNGASSCLGYKDEKWFIRTAIDSASFPCVDSPELSSCEMKRRAMIKELWPGEKYGQYAKNADGSYQVNTTEPYLNSILTPIPIYKISVDYTVDPPDTTYQPYQNSNYDMMNTDIASMNPDIAIFSYRFKDSCIQYPTSIVKDGRTYINIRSLPVDTFIYIFNDRIAEALLPFHPDFCKLQVCDTSSFVVQFENLTTSKQAEAANRFVLDSVIKNDPIYKSALAAQKPAYFDRLGYFRNLSDKRLDKFALEQAYCMAGNNEEAGHCSKFLYSTQINNLNFIDSNVKQKYFDIFKGFYLGNRSYFLQRLIDSSSVSCGCNVDSIYYCTVFNDFHNKCPRFRGLTRILPDESPIFPRIFSATGNGLDDSLKMPQWMRDAFNAANNGTFSSTTAPSQIADSANLAEKSTDTAVVDRMVQQLNNCSASASVMTSLRDSLLLRCANGGYKALTPSVVSTVITNCGLTKNDLCHAFLVAYNSFEPSPLPPNYSCLKPEIYNNLKGFINRMEIKDLIRNATIAGSTTTNFNLNGTTNTYEAGIAAYLGVANTAQVTGQGFLDTIKIVQGATTTIINYIHLKVTGNSKTFDFYIKRKAAASPDLHGTTSLQADTAFCINDDNNAVTEGFITRRTAVVDMTVNGSATKDRYFIWSNANDMMTPVSTGSLAGCVTCVDIKDAAKAFKNEKATWLYDDGYNHPLFAQSLTNYLNYKLKKKFTYSDYKDLMNGCAISDSVEFKGYLTTVKVNCTSVSIANNFITALNSKSPIDLMTARLEWPAGSTIIFLDLNRVPEDSILLYKKRVDTALSMTGISDVTYLPVYGLMAFVKDGCTPSPALSTYGNFSATSLYLYLNGVKKPYTMYQYLGSYSAPVALSHANLVSNVKNALMSCPGTVLCSDAALLRSEDYSTTDKQSYLKYVYSLSVPAGQLPDSVSTANLKLRIAGFSTKGLSYDDPFCSKYKRDLYVYSASQTGHTGYQLLANTIISGVTGSSATGNRLFPNSNASTVSPNLKVYRKANDVYWYRYFDANNNLYNVYLEPPANAALPLNTLVLDNIELSGGTDTLYRFTAHMHYNNTTPTIYVDCRGYTDFPIGLGQKLSNVILHEKPGNDQCLETIDCEYDLMRVATGMGKSRHSAYFDSLSRKLTDSMYYFVVNNTTDTLILESQAQKNHMTLYYYDLAGNLVETVPPAGVVLNGTHKKVTYYKYNSRNQLIAQISPDLSDTTRFFYDAAGRLVFSQNAKQAPANKYSYTLYDKQSRITETGEVPLPPPPGQTRPDFVQNVHSSMYPMDSIIKYVRTKTRADVVETYYDTMTIALGTIGHLSTQENLFKRVSAIRFYENRTNTYPNSNGGPYDFSIYYSYDMVGNIKTVTYSAPKFAGVNQQYKRVDYEYDQVSGKVNAISYNRNRPDQYFQRYEYDADNRITKVETSNDGIFWNNDAIYTYYKHGPLAQMRIGDRMIQSLEYAYTIQGWLKAINGDVRRTDKDMGLNGAAGDKSYPRDVIAHTLQYFKGDYKPIGTTSVTALAEPNSNLYNGNIAVQTTSIAGLGNMQRSYRYDQVQRLKLTANANVDENALTVASPSNIYKSSYSYDPDGNIQTLQRYDGNSSVFDNLSYTYNTTVPDNRLQRVQDGTATTVNYDLKQGQLANNYKYDPTGNLVKDEQALQKMDWSLYGKTRWVQDTVTGEVLNFEYDGLGNRIQKEKIRSVGGNELRKGEYYVRDASGNILAVYNYSRKYGKLELIAASNGGIRGTITLTDIITDKMSSYGSFKNLLTGMAVQVEPGWTGTITDRDISFYFNASPGMLNNILHANPGCHTDLRDWDNTNNSLNLISTALTEHGTNTSPLIMSVMMQPDPGRKMLEYLDTHMDPVALDDLWGTHEQVRSPGMHALNAQNLYDYAQVHGQLPMLSSEVATLVTSSPGAAPIFYKDVMADDQVFMDPQVRLPGGPFENTISDAVYAHGDQNQLYTFFDQWTGSQDYLNTVPAQEKLNMVYDDDKTAVISGFLGTASATAIDEVIAGMSEVSPFDYARIVIDAGYGDEIMNLPQGLHADTMWLAEHHLYGSSRLGTQRYDDTTYRNTYDINVAVTPKTGLNTAMPWYSFDYGDISAGNQKVPFVAIDNSSWTMGRRIGMKQYELTDHLGNVLATVLDRKTGKYINESDTLYSYYHADLASVQDYYPFGMLMPNRFKFAGGDTTKYRFGYNGQQKDNEISGVGNHNSALFWEYDTRLGRRWNLDPKADVSISSYAAFSNNPIMFTDVLGDTTNYYNSANGKSLGTVYGSAKYGDRYLSEDAYNKMAANNKSSLEAATSSATTGIQNPKNIAAITGELNAQFTNQLEKNLNEVSNPIDLGSTVGLLARIGFAEFRGSGSVEQQAGMDITLNRVGVKGFSKTLEGVITQPWQYSSLNSGDPNKPFYVNPYAQMYTKDRKGNKVFSLANHNAWTRTVENAWSIAHRTVSMTQGATLYYSPKSMRPIGSKPGWNFSILTEVFVPGVDPNHIKMYKSK